MIYIQYLFLVPLSLVVTLVGLLLAPILPLFAIDEFGALDNNSKTGIGRRLPKWLDIFMTPDNDLYGDSTFQSINGLSYLSQVKWLLRNPAYSFALRYIGFPYQLTVTGDPSIKDNQHAKEGFCFVTANDLFQLRYIKRIPGTSRCLLVNLGWNIMVLADPNTTKEPLMITATFVFSPRISGYLP